MHPTLTRSLCTLLVVLAPALAVADSPSEIDEQVWSAVSRTVVDHDIEGMAALYHPDAVLVSSGGAFPIGSQLERWGADMVSMREAGTRASVAFRFASRNDGEETAFETGMFRYATIDAAGNERASYVELEALLVKRGGRWLILMERQLRSLDEAAWNALE